MRSGTLQKILSNQMCILVYNDVAFFMAAIQYCKQYSRIQMVGPYGQNYYYRCQIIHIIMLCIVLLIQLDLLRFYKLDKTLQYTFFIFFLQTISKAAQKNNFNTTLVLQEFCILHHFVESCTFLPKTIVLSSYTGIPI